jgi:predicted metal-dependent phosphoesterase TrpH
MRTHESDRRPIVTGALLLSGLLFFVAGPLRGAERDLVPGWDLHVHCDCSDGLLAPEALVREAAKAKVELLGLADHDTLDCLDRAGREARVLGIRLVPSIEVSVEKDRIHIVGIGIDPKSPRLEAWAAKSRGERFHRAKKILERLASFPAGAGAPPVVLDFVDDLLCPRLALERKNDGLSEVSPEVCRELGEERLYGAIRGQLTRADVARALFERGKVPTYQAAFDLYLKDGSPAQVDMESPGFAEAISLIQEAGGVAVLSHPEIYFTPGRFPMETSGGVMNSFEDLLLAMFDAGIDGVERYRWALERNEEAVSRIEAVLAVVHRGPGCEVLRTVGSDFHAPPRNPSTPTSLGAIAIPRAEALLIEARVPAISRALRHSPAK